jgi:hypothetical protein
MSKRENRLTPILHEQRAVRNLKTLVPNTTPPESMALSNALVEIAVAALDEVAALENGESVDLVRLAQLVDLVADLPQHVP